MSEFDSEMQVEGPDGWEHLANVKDVPPPTQRRPQVFGASESRTVSQLRDGICPHCARKVFRIDLAGRQRELRPLGAKDGWREYRAVDDSFVTIWQSLPCECLWAIVDPRPAPAAGGGE